MFVPASTNPPPPPPSYTTQFPQSGYTNTSAPAGGLYQNFPKKGTTPPAGGGPMRSYGHAPAKIVSPYSKTTNSPYLQLHSRMPDIGEKLTWLEQVKDNRPWFYCSFLLDHDRYFGEGHTKKVAKQKLAEKLLPVVPVPPKTEKTEKAPLVKSSFAILHERILGINDQLVFTEELVNKIPHFHCSITYGGKNYSADGNSKKQAKHNLAEILLPIVPEVDASNSGNKLKIPLGPSKSDQAWDKFRSLLSPEEEQSLELFKLEDLTIKGPTTRTEERLFRCTITLRGHTFTASSITKKGAQGGAAIQALKKVFSVDTKEYLGTPSVEFKGHSLYYAAGEMCARKQLRISSVLSITDDNSTVGSPKKTFQFTVKMSNGVEYAGAPSKSKKEAVDNAAKKILTEMFRVSDTEMAALVKVTQ